MNSSIRKEARTISRKENGQGYLDDGYIIIELSISDQFSRKATAIAIVSLVVEFVFCISSGLVIKEAHSYLSLRLFKRK